MEVLRRCRFVMRSSLTSGQARAAMGRIVAALLGLPRNFSVGPRNFLILPKIFEVAFDSDVMMLLPRRGEPPSVAVRFNCNPGDTVPAIQLERLRVFCDASPTLYLPRAAEPDRRVPWLRVLGLKALSAIRAREEEAGAMDDIPDFIDVNVSTDAQGVQPLMAVVNKGRAAGTRYRQ